MKKLMLFLICFTQAIQACNLCLDYPKKKKFRKENMEKVACNCNCTQQPRSSHDEKYKCLSCDHRLIPAPLVPYKKTDTPELLQETKA